MSARRNSSKKEFRSIVCEPLMSMMSVEGGGRERKDREKGESRREKEGEGRTESREG